MWKGGWAEGVTPISFLSPGSSGWWLPEAGASMCQLQTSPQPSPAWTLDLSLQELPLRRPWDDGSCATSPSSLLLALGPQFHPALRGSR